MTADDFTLQSSNLANWALSWMASSFCIFNVIKCFPHYQYVQPPWSRIQRICSGCYLCFSLSWNEFRARIICIQGTSGVDASGNFGTRSSIPQCFTCKCKRSYTSSFYMFYMSWYYQFYLRQIPDVFPVLAAAYKTLVAKSRELLTTRTLHSELVYNYSGSKHVTRNLLNLVSLFM